MKIVRKRNDNRPVDGVLKMNGKADDLSFAASVKWIMKPEPGTGLQRPFGLYAKPVSGGGTFVEGSFFYVVTALDANGNESLPSDEAGAIPPDDGEVLLSWNGVIGAESYRVYRGAEPGVVTEFFEVEDSEFRDTGAAGTSGTPPTTDARIVTCEILDAEAAEVRMTPTAGLFDTPGLWWVEYEVVSQDATPFVQTYPNDDYIQLEVLPDLS